MQKAEEISQEETINLLNKCWMTHDGMWFFHCLQKFGIKAVNEMNKSAIKSLAGIEIKRVKNILDCDGSIDNFDRFKYFFSEASKLIIPDFMNVTFDYTEKDNMTWRFESGQCFAYSGVKRLGAIDGYECGVLYRIECWLDELGIRHRFTPEVGRCHMHTTGKCSGEIQLFV